MKQVLLASAVSLTLIGSLNGQSKFGTILGTVEDASGGVVPNATVKITNTDENASRHVVTNSAGDYDLVSSQPAHYEVTISASGFAAFPATNLLLAARQTLRVDATLAIGQASNTVTVESSEAGVITTDTQTIQATMDSRELLNLPADIGANGNTGLYQAIQLLPGVQSDQSGNFSIQGGIPSQT
jgi:Carboxypeptidase regulatory-like domain